MSSLFSEARTYLLKKSPKSTKAQNCLKVLEYYRMKAMFFQKLHLLEEIQKHRQAANVPSPSSVGTVGTTPGASLQQLHGDLMKLLDQIRNLEENSGK